MTDPGIGKAVRPIEAVAAGLGIGADGLEICGRDQAKLHAGALLARPVRGKLILVTAITPTGKGAGKTVTAIALGQALGRLGVSHCLCLRQPSQGPVFGMKGGGTGGGRAQLHPARAINLHFTGDLHAVTAAHNLLAALIDNHVHFGNALELDVAQLTWPRVLDVCDRQLRSCEIGLGGKADGFAHFTRFDITAASEIMTILALVRDRSELEARLGRIVIARDRRGEPRHASELGVVGALSVLLEQALLPNLVQTLEGTPALVHMGPFGNIAHGCSSVLATRSALGLVDYVITEAGFGAELGAEKFLHIKCRQSGLKPAAAVLVVSCAMLRHHGGAVREAIERPDVAALRAGLPNLCVHVENLRRLGMPCVVALNAYPSDSAAEIAAVHDACAALGVECARSDGYIRGGEGALDLAQAVKALADRAPSEPRFLYEPRHTLVEKIEAVAREIYRADGVDYDPLAASALAQLQARGFGELSVCIAKTQYSLSDDEHARNVPTGKRLRVRAVELHAGAGFVVVKTGTIVTMPGLPREPNAQHIGFDAQGRPLGLD